MSEVEALRERLALAQRSQLAHDFVLRALLTRLAVSSPQAYGGLVAGSTNSLLYAGSGSAGQLTREVANQLVTMPEEIAASLQEPSTTGRPPAAGLSR